MAARATSVKAGDVLSLPPNDYANDFTQGHCIPGGTDGGFISCIRGGNLDWGPVVLEWFEDHPKR